MGKLLIAQTYRQHDVDALRPCLTGRVNGQSGRGGTDIRELEEGWAKFEASQIPAKGDMSGRFFTLPASPWRIAGGGYESLVFGDQPGIQQLSLT